MASAAEHIKEALDERSFTAASDTLAPKPT